MEPKDPVSLLDLPGEVRNRIYTLLWEDALRLRLTPGEVRDVERCHHPASYWPGRFPLAYTSRQIRREFLSVYYSNFTWRFTVPFQSSTIYWRKPVHVFLNTIGELGAGFLRTMHLRAYVSVAKIYGKVGSPVLIGQHIGVRVEVRHETPLVTVSAITGNPKTNMTSLKEYFELSHTVWKRARSAVQDVFALIANEAQDHMLETVDAIVKRRGGSNFTERDVSEMLHEFEKWARDNGDKIRLELDLEDFVTD